MSKRIAARAGAWSALDIVLRQIVQFSVSLILARLLAPGDFGLIALLGFFIGMSIVFVQGGLSLALVQRQETTLEEESTVFWVNLIAGILFALILVAIAPQVARFYGYPVLRELMYVAGALIVLSALGAVQGSLMTRNLRFDQITLTGIISSLVSAVAGIWAAYAGYGVWALAIQSIAGAAVSTVALWVISDWRPTFSFRLASIRELYRFGFYMSISSALEVLYGQGFTLIIGKTIGVRELGFSNRAYGIQSMPVGILTGIVARTALPLFASRVDDPAALKRGFKLSVGLVMLLGLPMMAGLGLLSDLAVMTLLGEKWMPSAPLVTIMAIGGALLPLHVLNLHLLMAQGRSKEFLKLEIQKKAFGVVLTGIGCFFGIEGVAWAGTIFSFVAVIINARPTGRSIGYGIWAQFRDLWDVAAATVFMSVIVLVLKDALVMSPPIELATLTVVGAAAYAAFGFGLRLPNFRDAFDTLKLLRKADVQVEALGTA